MSIIAATSAQNSVISTPNENTTPPTAADHTPLPTGLYDIISTPASNAERSLIDVLFRPYAPQRTLWPTTVGENSVEITTADGYKVNFTGKQESWTITTPEGQNTRIWGDPHVDESDGDRWDFTKQSSFTFGNNKVTVETTPFGNGQTLSKTVTIYNGKDRLTITDIDKNKLSYVAWSLDSAQHDEKLTDGDVYRLETAATGNRFSWKKEA